MSHPRPRNTQNAAGEVPISLRRCPRANVDDDGEVYRHVSTSVVPMPGCIRVGNNRRSWRKFCAVALRQRHLQGLQRSVFRTPGILTRQGHVGFLINYARIRCKYENFRRNQKRSLCAMRVWQYFRLLERTIQKQITRGGYVLRPASFRAGV